MDVLLALLDPVAEKVVTLADDYATQIVQSIPESTEDDLREGIAGALLSFLADVVASVS